jgi:hypothetical protein
MTSAAERDFDIDFATLVQQGAGALLVGPDPFLSNRGNKLIALAARYRLPAAYPLVGNAKASGTSTCAQLGTGRARGQQITTADHGDKR